MLDTELFHDNAKHQCYKSAFQGNFCKSIQLQITVEWWPLILPANETQYSITLDVHEETVANSKIKVIYP